MWGILLDYGGHKLDEKQWQVGPFGLGQKRMKLKQKLRELVIRKENRVLDSSLVCSLTFGL